MYESTLDNKLTIGHFTKDKDGYYIEMCEVLRSFLPMEFHRDLKIQDGDSGLFSGAALDSIRLEDALVRRIGKTRSRSSVQALDGSWHHMHGEKRSAGGMIHGRLMFERLDEAYNGWFTHIDPVKELLFLPSGSALDKKDLDLARMLLRGASRKYMGLATHISVKAVEKRLRNMREKLCDAMPGCGCISLQDALHRAQLIDLLFDFPNCFKLEPTHKCLTVW